MGQIAYIFVFALAIWWMALTLLSIRDDVITRKAAKMMPPLTEEEKREIEELEADLARKKFHPFGWYLQHPRVALRLVGTFLIHLPFILLFFPLLLFVILPNQSKK